MKRWKIIRRCLWVLALLLAGCLLAFPVGKRVMRWEVARQLSAFGEGRIEIANVTLGIRQQTVHGLQLVSAGSSKPWVQLKTVTLDLSIWQALQGQTTPDQIHIDGGTIMAELAADGTPIGLPTDSQLLLSLPADTIAVTNLTVRVSQPQRQPLEARIDHCRLQSEGDTLQAEGSLTELLNASWEFSGEYNPKTEAVTAAVQSSTVQIDSDALRNLPLAPEIPVAGRVTLESPIRAKIARDAAQNISYRLKMDPRAIDLQLPGIEIPATNGRGTVIVDNGQVSIEAFQADIGAGHVTADGTVDFTQETADGKITISMRDIQLADLPQDWPQLPPDWANVSQEWKAAEVRGVLNGDLDLEAAYTAQRLIVLGGGRVNVANVEAFGISTEPIAMRIALAAPRAADSLVGGTVTVTSGVTAVDLRAALRALNLSLANLPPFTGVGSGQATVVVPLESVTDLASYQATGVASFHEASVMNIDGLSGSTNMAWQDGKLTLTEVALDLEQNGNISGSATIPIAANEPIAAEFTAHQLPASLLSKVLPDVPTQVAGDVSGHAKFQVPTDRVADLKAWQATGSVQSDQITYDRIVANDLSAQFTVHENSIQLREASGMWRGAAAHADATLDLQAPFAFSADFHSDAISLPMLAESFALDDLANIAGTVQGQGSVTGTLVPFQWHARGQAEARQVTVDRWSLATAKGTWEADPARLQAKVTDLKTLGGSVALSAVVPLDLAGKEQLTADLSHVSATQVTQLVPLTLPVQIGGELNGQATINGFLQPPQAQMQASLQGMTVSAEGLQTTPMKCVLDYQAGAASIELETGALGSTVQFRGSGQVDILRRKIANWTGHCAVRGLSCRQIAKLLKKNRQLEPFRGTADLVMDLHLASENALPTGEGKLTVRNVRYQHRILTSELHAQVALNEDRLVLSDLRSNIAGGVARGNVSLRLKPLGTGQFTLTLDRLSSQVLLATEQNILREVRGPVSVVVRGQIGPTMYGRGQAVFSNTRVADVRLENVQAPFQWTYRPTTGQGRIKIQLKSARIAQGRVQANVDLAWGQRIDLTADAQATTLDLKQLSRSLPFLDHWLTGKVNGRLHVKGRNIQSLDDLSGDFDATLLDSQTLALPVLDSLTSNLGLGSATSESFRTTEAKGSFRRGVLYLDQMTLERPQQRVWIEGEINTRGRLDFNVTADTRQLTAAAVAVGVLRPLDLVRRRLLFFHLGGTVNSPVVQPRTTEFVQQEVLLFFVPFAIPTPPAGF